VDIRAWHLPPADDEREYAIVAQHDGTRATAPVLSAAQIGQICRQLLAAREQLMGVSVARVIAAIDSAAHSLLDPAEPARGEALAGLTAISGFSPPMAAHLLDRAAQDWLQPALEHLIDVELGGAAAIEGFVDRAPGIRSRAVAPPLGFHVFSGNVPGVSVTSMVRALLVRSAVFGKSAAGEPVLAPLFASLLTRADPVVGACLAVTYWPGGDESREAAVLDHARLVVHYGGADAIASLRRRAGPDVRFVEHGPRISFAIIGPAVVSSPPADAGAPPADGTDAAADLARAVALFDQQGCVSPQIAFVVGSEEAAGAFAERVAGQLQRIQADLPRGRLDRAEAAAIRQARTRAEFDAIAGGGSRVWQGRDLTYTVIFSTGAGFHGSCLNRTLFVRNVAGVSEIIEGARPYARFLQTVGVAGFTTQERTDLAARLAEIGVSRTTSIAAMPWPPATWHHDGHGPLNEFVRWVDLEDPPDHAGSDSRNSSRI
jgi:acyl-CoA reductase-like NAD-dependent aldehyde dehydrogenase